MNKTTELAELERLDLHTMDVAELKSLLNQSLQITTSFLMFLARVWKELEDRGEDLSELRHGLMRYMPLVASGKMDASVLIKFSGQQLLLRELALLPLEEQQRLANGEKVPLVTRTQEGYVTKYVDLPHLHSRYYVQIFSVGKLRTEVEQIAQLELRSPRRKQAKVRRKKVSVDLQKGAIQCGTTAILIDDVLTALAKASGKTGEELATFLGLGNTPLSPQE